MSVDSREEKLPVWAKQLIADLRRRIEAQGEPLVRELARLRPQVDLLKARNEALTELLECAARGGHKTAEEIMEIIRSYSLTLTPEE